MENSKEIWQTEINGQIYETNLEGLAQWIAEGSLLPQDKVRRGNLRWLEANKVPALYSFFNAKELGSTPAPVLTTNVQTEQVPETQTFSVNIPQPFVANQQTFSEPPPPQFYQEFADSAPANLCVIHTETKADYACDTCSNYFCQECPAQNVCPMCGAMCRQLETQIVPQTNPSPQPVIPDVAIEAKHEEIKKGANWFYWIAAMSVVNSIIMMTGADWAFIMGLGITQIFDGIADVIAESPSGKGIHYIVFAIDLCFAGFFALLGFQAGKAKKWAFIVGLVIYSLDGIIYLLAGSFLGVAIHALAIFCIIKGMAAIKK